MVFNATSSQKTHSLLYSVAAFIARWPLLRLLQNPCGWRATCRAAMQAFAAFLRSVVTLLASPTLRKNAYPQKRCGWILRPLQGIKNSYSHSVLRRPATAKSKVKTKYKKYIKP